MRFSEDHVCNTETQGTGSRTVQVTAETVGGRLSAAALPVVPTAAVSTLPCLQSGPRKPTSWDCRGLGDTADNTPALMLVLITGRCDLITAATVAVIIIIL